MPFLKILGEKSKQDYENKPESLANMERTLALQSEHSSYWTNSNV